jgi:hypothetical protein
MVYGGYQPASAYGQPGPTPEQAADEAVRQMAERARDVRVRQQAVGRMRYMSVMHATHAWDRRYRDPIAPYGLAILYAHNDPAANQLKLTAATKLWLDGDETEDLPRLLFNLVHIVGQDAAGKPGYDVSRDLANRIDKDREEDSWYVGLGVSSLDTHTGTWTDARDRASSYTDIPAVIRIVLVDGTIVVCDRRGMNEFNNLVVHSSRPLAITGPMDSPYPYSAVSVDDLYGDPTHGPILRWMEELSALIWRLEAARTARGGPK